MYYIYNIVHGFPYHINKKIAFKRKNLKNSYIVKGIDTFTGCSMILSSFISK